MSGVHLMRQPRLLREIGFWQHLVVIAIDTAFHFLALPISACLTPPISCGTISYIHGPSYQQDVEQVLAR